MKYKVVVGDGIEKLMENVNTYISTGWVPLGGVMYTGGIYFMQAMTKTEQK